MKLTVRDYRAIAGSRFYAQKMKAIAIILAALILWLVVAVLISTPEVQDTVYVAPSGVEAVKPHGESYIVIDKIVWLAEEQDNNSPSTGLLVVWPVLCLLGGAFYLFWKEEEAKTKLVDEYFAAKDD